MAPWPLAGHGSAGPDPGTATDEGRAESCEGWTNGRLMRWAPNQPTVASPRDTATAKASHLHR